MPFCFTRYLYIKEEVRCALLCAILSRRKDEALFWAAELFCSGCEDETLELLWEIYYDFYAALNPSFETYLIRKCSDDSLNRRTLIISIVTNICLKPHTTDVYILRQMFSGTTAIATMEPTKWFEEEDFKTLAAYILGKPMTPQIMGEIRSAALKWCGVKTCLKMRITPVSCKVSDRRRFLSHIIQICTLRIYDVPRKNRLNISDKFIDNTKVIGFNQFDVTPSPPLAPIKNLSEFSKTLRAYDILKMGCKYKINESGFLPLFELQRYKLGENSLLNRYRTEWLYYASGTPFWANRTSKFGGTLDVSKKQVIFNDVNKEESFYELYGLEPDEQPTEIQNACVAPIVKETHGLKMFCRQFGGLNVFNYNEDLFDEKGVIY
jgi:hypothetical protein